MKDVKWGKNITIQNFRILILGWPSIIHDWPFEIYCDIVLHFIWLWFVGYLMPNPLYTYILNIYDLVWLVFMAYQPLQVIFIPNPVFTYILNMWFVNTFCRYTQLNDQTVLVLTIQCISSYLFAYSLYQTLQFNP